VSRYHADVAASAPSGSAEGDEARRVVLTPASSFPVRPIHWLWDGRLPLGAITLTAGREGVGKSILAYTLAADVTTGRLAGHHRGRPAAVLVAATEDSWSQTIVPRLIAAEADLEQVMRLQVETEVGRLAELSLPVDLAALESEAAGAGAALLILDPLITRLSGKYDSHVDTEVRQALEPLAAVAERRGLAVLGIIHVNKSREVDVLTSIMASRAFVALARTVLFIAPDPTDDDRLLVGLAKNNLGRKSLPCLGFRIGEVHVADTDDGEVSTGRLSWDGEDKRLIDEIVEASNEVAGDNASDLLSARAWLTDYLAQQDGVASSQDIKKAGRDEGHAEHTLKRARQRLAAGVANVGFPRRTYWSSPGLTPDQVEAIIAKKEQPTPPPPADPLPGIEP
jgi:hypothetical protein